MPGEITDPTARAGQVAALLRSRIYDGNYPAGSELPAQRVIASEYQISDATVNRAIAMLAVQGLVQTGSGRRTIVLPQYRYAVKLVLPADGSADLREVRRRLTERFDSDPSMSRADVTLTGETGAEFVFVLNAPNPGQAAIAAFTSAAFAVADGWDVTQAEVTITPSSGIGVHSRHQSQ